MSAPHRFDNLLSDWLEMGPESAPREDLATVLEEFPRIRQRSGFGPWRRPMPTFVRLAVAAVLAIAVGAVVLSQMVQPSGPSVGAESTPGWQDRFPTQTASTFVRPFSYAIDPSSGIELSNTGSTMKYQFGIPGDPGPLVVLDHPTAGYRLEPCTPDGGAVNAQPTPEEFVAYMQTVPGLKVTPLPPTKIDGRTAVGIDVQQRADPACQEHYLFGRDDDWTCCWPDDPTWVRRMRVLDVDGWLVIVTTPFGATNKDARLELANGFVDTIRFGRADTSPSAPN
jgi:hypothetical protein